MALAALLCLELMINGKPEIKICLVRVARRPVAICIKNLNCLFLKSELMKTCHVLKITLLLVFNCLFSLSSFAQGIQWTEGLSWEQVREKAKRENKYIFLDCFATWCGPCKMMDKEVFINDSVGVFFNERFISVHVQMDKTDQDNDQVKAWYNDADAIGKQYKIDGYPCFLFISPENAILQIEVGYRNVSKFLAIAREVTRPGKMFEYDQLLKDYEKGIVHYNRLLYMIKEARKFDPALARQLVKVYNDYLSTLDASRRYTKENIEYWDLEPLVSSSRTIQYFLQDWKQIDQVIQQKGYAASVVDRSIYHELVIPFFEQQNKNGAVSVSGSYLSGSGLTTDSSEADWEKLEKAISGKYNKTIARRNVLAAKIEWYKRHWNDRAVCEYMLIKLNKYPPDFKFPVGNIVMELNSVAWTAFMKLTDKKILNGYRKWMERIVKDYPYGKVGFLMDTYANLLYKTGRKKEAVVWEEKAVLAGGMDVKQFEISLTQMRKGEPTYIGVAVWNGISSVHWDGVKFKKWVLIHDAKGKPIQGVTVLNRRSGESVLSNEKGAAKMEVLLGDYLSVIIANHEPQQVAITKEPGHITVTLKHSGALYSEVRK